MSVNRVWGFVNVSCVGCGLCTGMSCVGVVSMDSVRVSAPWMGSGMDLGQGYCVWNVERRRVTGDSALPRVNTLDPTVGQAGLGATALPGDELASKKPKQRLDIVPGGTWSSCSCLESPWYSNLQTEREGFLSLHRQDP